MSNTLFIAITTGLAGMFGWGLADFFAKKTIDKVGDMATLAWAHLYGVIILFSLVMARQLSDEAIPNSNITARELGLLVFFGFLQAAVYAFVYRAFGKGKLAILNPIFSSYSGIVIILSVVVFGEIIGGSQLFFLTLLFLGILITNLDQESFAVKKLKLAKIAGMREILLAVILAAGWTVLWGKFVSGKDWLLYAALMYFFMSVSILVFCWLQKVKLGVLRRDTWKYFLLIGASEVVAYVGVSIGYSLTDHTSIVAVISSAFSIPTIFLAYLFLKEDINKFQVTGTIVVIASVILVSLV